MVNEEVNPRAVAAEAAVLGLLGAGAHDARGLLNTSADTAMDPGERFSARVAGRSIGRFVMPKDPVHVEITDWGALRDWCDRNRPEEVHDVVVRQVSPTFVRWILELAPRDEEHRAVVDHNGEPIAGVTVRVGAAAATLTLDDDAPATLARLLTNPATRDAAAGVVERALAGVLGVPEVRLILPGHDDGAQRVADDPPARDSAPPPAAAPAAPPSPVAGASTWDAFNVPPLIEDETPW